MHIERCLVRGRADVLAGCLRCCGHTGPKGDGANVEVAENLLVGLVLVGPGLGSFARRGGASSERPGFCMAQHGIEESLSRDSPLGADTPDELATCHVACEECGRADGRLLLSVVTRARREVCGGNVGPLTSRILVHVALAKCDAKILECDRPSELKDAWSGYYTHVLDITTRMSITCCSKLKVHEPILKTRTRLRESWKALEHPFGQSGLKPVRKLACSRALEQSRNESLTPGLVTRTVSRCVNEDKGCACLIRSRRRTSQI